MIINLEKRETKILMLYLIKIVRKQIKYYLRRILLALRYINSVLFYFSISTQITVDSNISITF